MNNNPKISIIVPVYNAEKYIEECLSSVKAQTFQDIEVIIIDDGSTDNTPEIVNRYVQNDSRFSYYIQSHKGVYAARKKGLQLSLGDYIGWVDADDYVDPEMFQILYETAIENKSDLVFCDYNPVPYKPKYKNVWFKHFSGTFDVDYIECNSQLWNKLVSKKLLDEIDVENKIETCFEEIYIKVLLHARNTVSIDKKLYFYRYNPGSLSKSYKNIEHYKGFVDASYALREECSDISDEYWKQYFDFRVLYYLILVQLISANANNIEQYRLANEQYITEKARIGYNMHFAYILRKNNGLLKAFFLRYIVPSSFYITKTAANILLK